MRFARGLKTAGKSFMKGSMGFLGVEKGFIRLLIRVPESFSRIVYWGFVAKRLICPLIEEYF